MCKRERLVRGLVAMSVVILLGSMLAIEANATTCSTKKLSSSYTCVSWKTSGGTKYCSLWCTGSEVCDVVVNGLGSAANQCTPGETCPAVTCSVFGTVDSGDGFCEPGTLDPNCDVQGVAICENPKCTRGNKNDPECTGNFQFNGRPFTLEVPLSVTGDLTLCDKQGTCRTSLVLEAGLSSEICINPNWAYKTFTASEANTEACFCPGGYDGSVPAYCCADSQRNLGACVTPNPAGTSGPGTATCIAQFCKVDLTGYVPGQNILYTCCDAGSPECPLGQVYP